MDNDAEDFDLNEEEIEAGDVNIEAYEKGFNDGFLIGEHHPELAEALVNDLVYDGGRNSGMLAGLREFFRMQEVRKSREDELDEIRNRGNRDIDRNR